MLAGALLGPLHHQQLSSGYRSVPVVDIKFIMTVKLHQVSFSRILIHAKCWWPAGIRIMLEDKVLCK